MGALARAVPTRTCVSCRTSRDKRALLRVLRTPGGRVAVDPTGRANGRGAYVCPDAACIERAVAKGGLGRALEAPLPDGLRSQLIIAAGLAEATAATMPEPRAYDTDIQED